MIERSRSVEAYLISVAGAPLVGWAKGPPPGLAAAGWQSYWHRWIQDKWLRHTSCSTMLRAINVALTMHCPQKRCPNTQMKAGLTERTEQRCTMEHLVLIKFVKIFITRSTILRCWFKGMEQIIVSVTFGLKKEMLAQCPGFKCSPWHTDCCCWHLLFYQPDSTAQKSELEEFITMRGHICDFYPKFHCELNFIEQYWGAVKYFYRNTAKTADLECLDEVPLLRIWRYVTKKNKNVEVPLNSITDMRIVLQDPFQHMHKACQARRRFGQIGNSTMRWLFELLYLYLSLLSALPFVGVPKVYNHSAHGGTSLLLPKRTECKFNHDHRKLLYISRDLANATNAHIFLTQLWSVVSHSIRLVSP